MIVIVIVMATGAGGPAAGIDQVRKQIWGTKGLSREPRAYWMNRGESRGPLEGGSIRRPFKESKFKGSDLLRGFTSNVLVIYRWSLLVHLY